MSEIVEDVNLDIPRPGRGLVTFRASNKAGGIIRQGRKWLAEEGTAGTVVGEATTRLGAVQVLADFYGITNTFNVIIEKDGDL